MIAEYNFLLINANTVCIYTVLQNTSYYPASILSKYNISASSLVIPRSLISTSLFARDVIYLELPFSAAAGAAAVPAPPVVTLSNFRS